MEVVDSFNYLGTVFIYNGKFALNNDFIIGKALKALNVLLYNCKRYPMKPSVLCQLIDAFVGSRLSYSEEIERVHLKFCKRISNMNEFMFYWSTWRTSTLPFVYSTLL